MSANKRSKWSSLPRTIDQIAQPEMQMEAVRRINGATVMWVDYELLRRDFPVLRNICIDGEESASGRRLIDDWLLRRAAVISEPQSEANEVNGTVPTAERSAPAYRPPRYGRAVILPVDGNEDGDPACLRTAPQVSGLFDVKGCGVAPGQIPRAALDATGLVNLPEAIRELIIYRLINTIFCYLNIDVAGVGIYAILNLDFYGRLPDPNGWTAPAASIIRQGHHRVIGNNDVPPKGSIRQRASIQIELMLRHFGLTSSSPCSQLRFENEGDGITVSYGRRQSQNRLLAVHAKWVLDELSITNPCEFDCVNVQFTRDVSVEPLRARLFDFGQYEYRSQFDLHLLSAVRDRPFNWGGTFLTSASDWIQPSDAFGLDKDLFHPRCISDELANWRGPGRQCVLSGLVEFSYELTKRIEQNVVDRAGIETMIDNFVDQALRLASIYFERNAAD